MIPNKTIVAIGAITAIVITCIVKDINGWIAFTGLSLIAGLGGFIYGRFKKP